MSKIELFNCDCMEYMKDLPDNYFELAISDPPYREKNTPTKSMREKLKGKMNTFLKPTKEYWDELFRISKNQIIWGANNFIEHLKNTECMIFWDKAQSMENYSDGEFAWTSFCKPSRVIKYVWSGNRYGTFDNIKGVGKPTCRIQPTQKPVYLYKWLLHNYTKPGDKIFDSHLGSGSIAIACHDMEFDLIGCEIDPDYYNDALKRLKEHQRQLRLF